MKLPANIISQDLTVERSIPGHTDPDTGQWIEATTEKVADINDGSLVPKSGGARATAIQTVYESDYDLYAGKENIVFEEGYSELKRGDIITDSRNRKYRLVFPGHYGPAYACELKEILGDDNNGD